MKKIITLASAMVFALIGYSQSYVSEDFSTFTMPVQPPATSGWKSVDSIPNRMSDSIWRFDNLGGVAVNSPIVSPFASADGDAHGNGFLDDTYLETVSFDASLATTIILEFDHIFRAVGTGFAEVQVFDGINWVSDTIYTANTYPGFTPASSHATIDISQYVAGVANAQVRFRYNDPGWGWFWIIDNVSILQPAADDARTFSVNNTGIGCGFTAADSVYATVINPGSTTISNIPINYTINGAGLVAETIMDTLLPGDTVNYTFATTANFSTVGTYNIAVFTSLRADNNLANDTAFGVNIQTQAVATYPYSEGFENGNGNWVSSGISNTWANGVPAGTVINSAANGMNAYVTNLTGDYTNNEESYVTGPCFDFTNLNAPQFKMNIFWNSENSWDGAVLQMSLNDGLTWTQVGALGDPNNWYTDGSINGLQNAGFTGEGWTGDTNNIGSRGWVLAEHDLVGAANQPSVLLRVAFGSDGSVTREGIAIDDIIIQEAPAVDGGITSFQSPVTGCGLGAADSVCVFIANFGAAAITNFPITYEFNGNIFTDTVNLTINPGDTVVYCFDSTINISANANYSIIAYTDVATDGNLLNDSASNNFDNIPIVSGYPYLEGFENGNGGWVSAGSNSTWAVGAPIGAVINSAANGFNSYVTNLSGNYNNNEESYVQGPCFDFTTLAQPQFKMNVWWNSEFSWDGAVLQSSINGGATWQKIGAFGDPNNWYTDNSINGFTGPANLEPSGEGWTGRTSSSNGSGGWVLAEHDLPGLGGQPAVILRIAFGSDGSVQDEGFGFDDVLIQDAPAIDAAAFDIVQPNSACALSANEPIEIRIINSGSDTLFSVPAGFEIGAITYFDTLFTMLLPGDTAFLLFDSTANLSVSGDYNLTAYTSSVGDGNILNDSAFKTVTSVPTISSLPYSEGFENGTGGWLTNGTNVSWALGAPAGFNISTAGGGANSYVTNLSGNYNTNEISYLESPCVDLSTLTVDPIIRFKNTFNFGFDGESWLEQSVNGGVSWTKVLDNGGAINWYNNTTDQEWDNTSSLGAGVWVLAENPLTGAAGVSQFKLRFVMDGNAFSTGEGIGIDDIFIDLPAATDAGVIALIAPVTDCGLSATDSVKVKVKNFGSDTLFSTPVSYQVNGGATVTETITSTILPGDTIDFTFTMNTVNLSTTGSYDFKLFSSVALDGNPTNDTISRLVENTLRSAPYLEDFNTGFVSGTGFNNAGAVYARGWIAVPEPTNFAWGARTGPTGSTGTGPNQDRDSTGNYMFVEGSNGPTGDSAMLTSPCIDLTAAVNPRLSFWYHKFGSNMADLYVDIYDGTTWINGVDTLVGQVQTANADTFLLRDTTSLTNYLGGVIQVRFRSSGKTGFSTDMAIDDFRIYEGPVSINNIADANLEFSIFPNPTAGQFTIVTPNTNETLRVQILDAKGQLVYDEQISSSNTISKLVDMSNHAKGVYFVKISDSNSSRVEKLIVR